MIGFSCENSPLMIRRLVAKGDTGESIRLLLDSPTFPASTKPAASAGLLSDGEEDSGESERPDD
jgi:hypothetical protein